MSSQIDLKRPDKIVYYHSYRDEEPNDFLQLLTFITVFAAMLTKNKIILWTSLFLFLSNVSTLKTASELRQIFITLSLIFMNLVQTYFITPNLPQQQHQTQ